MRFLIGILAVFVATAARANPLFDEAETLQLVVEAPMRDLIRHKLDKAEYEATVTWLDPSGAEHKLPALLSTRGNARLEYCDFPPLRLTFDPAAAADGPFAGQKRLKMVTRCEKSSRASAWFVQELAIYRAYNLVTDISYRVRELDVTFRDSESGRRDQREAAFVIEDTDRLAERVGRVELRPPEVDGTQFDPAETTRNLLFQYLIGNTDFAVRRGPAGEGCCHNGRVVAVPGSQDGWVVVPYDFDQAGIIDTDYALPARGLGIRRVTSRVWRGFCWQNDLLADAIERFRALEPEFRAVLAPDDLGEVKKRNVQRYIDGFYAIVGNPEELRKRILDECRGGASPEIRETRTE